MGAAREKRKARDAFGGEAPLPPKIRKVTWTFELQPEGYALFQKVHAYMVAKNIKVPDSEESFAAGLLTIGLKTLAEKIAKEEEKNKTIWTPQDAREASRRLQAIKEAK